MADYIYLLQNRLTPAQRRALEAVRESARSRGMPVFLVGEAVRDLSSGSPVRDLEFALQGEVSELIQELQGVGATHAGSHPVRSSAYLTFPGGVRTHVSPTLAVTYPKPGVAEAQPAAILDDLRHRDFTANAMAISLNEGSLGLLLDPLNGIADIENRELRLVSNYGFIEQPALLLRAARVAARLGWNLEERTQARYENAREERSIDAIPEFDRALELEEIFHEEDPVATLEYLIEQGWSDALFPAWTPAKVDREGLEKLRELAAQMEQIGVFTDLSPVTFPLLTARLGAGEVAALKQRFARPGFVSQIESLDARSKELAAQLTSKAAAAPSDTWKLLLAAEPEVVLWLAYSSRSPVVQGKLKTFLNEWPQMRQRMPYALMQEMRITPDLPGYDQLLEDLFFAQMDGKLATTEATRAFLEPYSPPAPVVQAPPRRRPAKSARSRSKKVVGEAVAPEPEGGEDEESQAAAGVGDTKQAPVEPAVPTVSAPPAAEKPARTPAPKTTPARSSAKAPAKPVAPARPVAAPPAPVAGKKAASAPAVAKAAAPATRTAPKPPQKSAPSKAPAKTAAVAAKAKGGSHASAVHAPAPKKVAQVQKSSVPAKSHKDKSAAPQAKSKHASEKALPVKTVAKGAAKPGSNTGKAAAAHPAAKKASGASHSAAKKAPPAKKTHGTAAAKSRSHR